MKTLYGILGVDKNADRKAIADAYRSLAKKHHPDKGGDKEKFYELVGAYEILVDPALRAKYDETGVTPTMGPENQIAMAVDLILGLIRNLVAGDKFDPQYDDIVKPLIGQLEQNIREGKEYCAGLDKLAKKFDATAARIKSASGSENFQIALGHIAADHRRQITDTEVHIERIQFALDMVKGLKYSTDKKPRIAGPSTMTVDDLMQQVGGRGLFGGGYG